MQMVACFIIAILVWISDSIFLSYYLGILCPFSSCYIYMLFYHIEAAWWLLLCGEWTFFSSRYTIRRRWAANIYNQGNKSSTTGYSLTTTLSSYTQLLTCVAACLAICFVAFFCCLMQFPIPFLPIIDLHSHWFINNLKLWMHSVTW